MQIWHVAVIVLAAILIGMITGILLSYLLLRLVYHNDLDLMTVCRILFGKQYGPISLRIPARNPRERHASLTKAGKRRKMPASTAAAPNNNGGGLSDSQLRNKIDLFKLFSECEQNRKKIKGGSGEGLVPLQTEAWDTNRSLVSNLDSGLRSDIEAVYTDIALLNNLVWLSTEFHRSGPDIQAQYRILSENIAMRLDAILEATSAYFAVEK